MGASAEFIGRLKMGSCHDVPGGVSSRQAARAGATWKWFPGGFRRGPCGWWEDRVVVGSCETQVTFTLQFASGEGKISLCYGG